jgi:ATP-dependent DNA helicase RecG
MCLEAGIAPPKFEEITGAAVVTFKVNVRGPQQVADHVVWRLGMDAVPSRDQVGTKSGPSRDQVEILRLCRQERTVVELMNASGRRNRSKFRDGFIKPLLEEGLLVLTIPDKPRSRMQRYKTTEAGLAMVTGLASGRPPVLPENPPDSGPGAPRAGGRQETSKGRKGR